MIIDGGLGRSIVRGAGFAIGVGIVALVALIGLAAINVLLLVFIAVILASGLQPIVAWLRGHLHVGRGLAILLVYGAFLLIVAGLVLVVVPAAISEFGRTLESLPPFFERARTWASTLQPAALSRTVGALIDAAARTLQPSTPAPGQVVQVGLTVAEGVTSILTLLTVVYFWLTEHARLQRYALAFVPERRRARARDVWNSAETRLGMWVRGQLILMASIGIMAGIAYTILGVPAGLVLGLFAALAEGIPIVGPLIGAIPAVLIAATISPQLALTVAGVYLVLQLVEGNILVPIVMRNTVGISPFLVILSVLIGGAAGGFAGALLAVPIAAAGEVLIEGLQAREVPVAQDASAIESTPDEDNAPDLPDPEGEPASELRPRPAR
ncbi:MAG TPA: AI-2E family transporter [Candidatus Limnocylindrales bacterium]|nr:AI-2E family transporter [Candidatus Limnocylindrales bacterium]